MRHQHRHVIVSQRAPLSSVLDQLSAEGWELISCEACRMPARGQDLIEGKGESPAWNLVLRRPWPASAPRGVLAQGELPVGAVLPPIGGMEDPGNGA